MSPVARVTVFSFLALQHSRRHVVWHRRFLTSPFFSGKMFREQKIINFKRHSILFFYFMEEARAVFVKANGGMDIYCVEETTPGLLPSPSSPMPPTARTE